MIKRQETQCQEVIAFRELNINVSGYGRVAKQVMADPSLTMTEKGLYCSLCSMTGGGDSSYTSRTNVLKELGISELAYEQCMDGLEAKNIIVRSQSRQESGEPAGIVGLVEVPKCYAKEIYASPDVELADYGSVYGLGWGLIPRLVMQDTRLSLEARALYGYLQAYAETKRCRLYDDSRLLNELAVTRCGLERYKQELVDAVYIERIGKPLKMVKAEP